MDYRYAKIGIVRKGYDNVIIKVILVLYIFLQIFEKCGLPVRENRHCAERLQ